MKTLRKNSHQVNITYTTEQLISAEILTHAIDELFSDGLMDPEDYNHDYALAEEELRVWIKESPQPMQVDPLHSPSGEKNKYVIDEYLTVAVVTREDGRIIIKTVMETNPVWM